MRDSVIGDGPAGNFILKQIIHTLASQNNRICDWKTKKHFWTNSVVTTWLWFLFEGAASAASRILQEMTPIFFQHPDKLNLVMLEGEQRDSGLHVTRKLYVNRRNFILPGNSMLSAETSCYQEKLCVTTRNFIFPAETSCYQQKLHVTRRNFMLTAETPCYQ